ncbi:phosphopantetheine-binding protein, partial [Methanobrevibacter sp.]|uniref:phosphopantetheine-binding protein n=1 Tax=Methanobrevibacter sp. TaxID=66852 RepID=UPI0038900A76
DEETTKAFLKNPFDEGNDYSVMYRTGDIVRVLADGSFGIVGRRDSQVKIRGNRVELSEIEAVIREIDYIEDLTVQTIKNGTNNELVAYVVVSDEFDGDLKEEISDYVDERKPKYMIPSFVIEMDEIPLNVNGKVDKHALPEVNVEELQVEYVAPTTETEKHIVEAFEKVFNQENIGIYDDFDRLGGDSITAIKIISLLSKYDIAVNARIIFENKTPYQIAKFIDEDQTEYGFYLAKEGTSDQNMFLLPSVYGFSIEFSQLVDNLEFEGNVYLIDDFKFDLTIDEIKNTNHNMTFEKYYEAIKHIFQDGDIIVGYSLGCLFAMLIVEKLEKDRKIGKCILIDGPLDFYCDEVPDKEEALTSINKLYDLGFDVDELGLEDHDELIDKMVEIIIVNSIWDFPAAKINDTPVIYLAADQEYVGGRLDDIARNGEFIFIDATNHSSIVTTDVKRIVKYLK